MPRRFFLIWSVTVLFIAALPNVAAAERLQVVDTSDGYLNLREGPGTGYAIIQRMYGGMEIEGVGASGTWRRVLLPDGRIGWASARYMTQRYVQRRTYDAYVARTHDGYLNLRSGPGTNYRIIQRLYAGQGLVDLGRRGSWMRVQLADGTTGWASSRYMY